MADAERHALVKSLFLGACDLEPESRARWLDEACHGDASLRAEVDALLGFEARRPDFLPDAAAVPPFASAPSSDAPLPRMIGTFRVLRCLGSGGMGTVYEVEQERPRRTVALKLLHPGLTPTSALRRFEREGEILGRLQHPGIARIYEAGRIETPTAAQPYLAMEYVRGETLTRHARTLIGPRERLRLFARVCDAVQHAHEQGIVHRDLKPANILVDASGQPKVLDFGVARVTDGDLQLATLQTGVGEIVGTLAYMSPEQASGDPGAVDARSDVYALGVLLFELLEAELPYDTSSGSITQALERIRAVAPRRMTTAPRLLGSDLETIVRRALEKEKDRRYASAAALAADVRRFLADEPIEARPPSAAYRARKFVRRHRTLVVAATVVLAALVTALAVSLRYGADESQARRLAEESSQAARAQAYESGLLAAQLTLERGNVPNVLAQLESLPTEQRGWEWGALRRRVDRTLAGLEVPGVLLKAYRDEEHIVHVDESGAVAVWDVVTGDDRPLGRPAPDARPLALSENGRWLLMHREGELLLCDLVVFTAAGADAATRVVPAPGCEPLDAWWCAAVDDDGRRAAVATRDDAVVLVELGTPPSATLLAPDLRGVGALRFSPDGSLLCVAGRAHLYVFESATRTELWRRRSPQARFDSVAFDLVHERVAIGIASGIEQHALRTGELLATWNPQQLASVGKGSPFRLDYDPTGRHLAALLRDGLVEVRDAETGIVEATARTDQRWKTSDLAWAPDGASFVTCGRKAGTLLLWDGELPTCDALPSAGASLYGLALSPDGTRVAAVSREARILCVWEVAGGTELLRLPTGGRPESLAWSADGARIACALQRSGLAVWDARDGAPLTLLAEPRARVVTYTPDGALLVAGGTDGALVLLDAESLAPRVTISIDDTGVQSLACSPDGRTLAVGTESGRIVLRDLVDGTELARANCPSGGPADRKGVIALAFSPDGRRLASGSGQGALALRAVPDLSVTRELVGHTGEVFTAAFTHDGRRLVSAGRDGRLRVWNAGTGGLLASFEDLGTYVFGLAAAPDDRKIVGSGGDGRVRVWDSAPASVGWRERRLAARHRPSEDG